MKRGLTILILLVSASLITTVALLPGESHAGAVPSQSLETTDSRDFLDDLIFDSQGKPDSEGTEGDPDTFGDGYGASGDQEEVTDGLLGGVDSGRWALNNYLAFLMSSFWLIP